MQKFNQGDIIIKNNKFYVAWVVTETSVAFRAKAFQSFFGYKGYSGCGGENAPSCCDTFILEDNTQFRSYPELSKAGKLIQSTDGKYIVVGKYTDKCCGRALFDFQILKQWYPEIYKEFLTSELEKFVNTDPLSPLPKPSQLKVVHKSKTIKKKNANKRSASKSKSR